MVERREQKTIVTFVAWNSGRNRGIRSKWKWRFDKSYNNRAHPPRGVALQNVLNNGEEANSPGEIYDSRDEDVLLFRDVSSLNGFKPEENVI